MVANEPRRNRAAPVVTLALMLGLLAGCNASGRPEGGAASETGGGSAAMQQGQAAQLGAPQPLLVDAGTDEYRVNAGDTVYGVAERFGVPVRTLIDSNGLKAPYRLKPGQALRVPARQEHEVRSGETLFQVAQIYGVDQSSLARVNGLSSPYTLTAGQRLVLPGRVAAQEVMAGATYGAAPSGGGMTVEELAPAAGALETADASLPAPPTPDDSSTASTVFEVEPQAGSQTAAAASDTAAGEATSTETTEPPMEQAMAGGRFIWPMQGKIVSRFGAKKGGLHNDGINIAAERGTEVLASDSGVVAYAGNELRGFGNLLLVRHADGWVSA